MKKIVLFALIAVVLVGTLAGCAAKKAETDKPVAVGPALITVKGKIADGTYVLDQAAFDANSKEVKCFDPWVGDSGKDVTEKGILLKDLITLVKPSSDATTISLIATDGKTFDVPIADAQKYDIVLSHWVDGTVLEEKTGGPVKVAYPADAGYANESWAWWLTGVEFK